MATIEDLELKKAIVELEKLWIKSGRVQHVFHHLMVPFHEKYPNYVFTPNYLTKKNIISVWVRDQRVFDLKWKWFEFRYK